MFNNNSIQACMVSLLGWQNDANPDVPQVTDPSLIASDSGAYYNEFHPLLTIENIVNSIDATEDINVYLRRKVNGGIIRAVQKMIINKKMNESTKTLLNSSRLFDGIAPLTNTIISDSSFVGVEVELKNSYGTSVIIDKIGLQFTVPQTDLNIYVFHTSQLEPIQTVTATTVKTGGSFEWLSLSEIIDLNYLSDEYDSGGLFYIGYFQDDISGAAINKDMDFNKGPCRTCNGGNAMKIWNRRLDFVRFTPVKVDNVNLNGSEMFDSNNAYYTPSNNYGLNFATTVECDLSVYFCENKLVLSQIIGRQVAMDVLSDILYSPRENRLSDINRNMIIRSLEGDPETDGLSMPQQMEKDIVTTSFDFSMIDSPCLPENKKYGVRKRAI